MGVDEADEAGAVEAGLRRVSAPAVRDTEQPPRVVNGAEAERFRGRDPAGDVAAGLLAGRSAAASTTLASQFPSGAPSAWRGPEHHRVRQHEHEHDESDPGSHGGGSHGSTGSARGVPGIVGPIQ